MRFHDVPIQRKLALLILAASVLALGLACIGFGVYERENFRAAAASELSILADTLGANAAASLAFDDPKSARDMLSALRADHDIVSACRMTMRAGSSRSIAVPASIRLTRCRSCARAERGSPATR